MQLIVDAEKNNWEQRAMVKAAEKAGWSINKAYTDCITRSGSSHIRVYGTIEFCDHVNNSLELGLSEVPAGFVPSLPYEYRKRDVYLIRSEFSKIQQYAQLTKLTSMFMKPPRNKEFEAKVYNLYQALPEMTELVLFSEPVKFEIEVRCFIRKQRLLTHCPYMIQHEPIDLIERDDDYWTKAYEWDYDTSYLDFRLTNFVNNLLDEIDLPNSCVLDVGYIKDRGWAVIELNNCRSSGIYDCDPDKVLRCLEAEISG